MKELGDVGICKPLQTDERV